MIVHLTAVRIDHIQGTEEVFIRGKAILNGDTLTAAECEPFSGLDSLTQNERGFVLVHRGETGSRIELPLSGRGKALAETVFGDMEFDAELVEYRRRDMDTLLHYRLRQNGEVVTDTELRFTVSADMPSGPA